MAEVGSEWSCEVCTFSNPPLAPICAVCGAAKDDSAHADGGLPVEDAVLDAEQRPFIGGDAVAVVAEVHHREDTSSLPRAGVPAVPVVSGVRGPVPVGIALDAISVDDVGAVVQAGAADEAALGPAGRQWACPACTFSNPESALACSMCGSEAPGATLEKRCQSCHRSKPQDNWMSCGHFHCAECLEAYLRAAVNDKRCNGLTCPTVDCTMALRDASSELNSCIAQDVVEAFFNSSTAEAAESDASMVACVKCGSRVSIDKDAPIDVPDVIHERDEEGNVLSVEAFVHFNRYRLRCGRCDTEYCAGCKASPYHKGHTCESFAEYGASMHCRFCASAITAVECAPDPPSRALSACCQDAECIGKRDVACPRTLRCGHPCGGVAGESKTEHGCLPCLEEGCPSRSPDLEVTGDDYCGICYCEGLNQAPSVQLACGHIFHALCLQRQIEAQWNGVKITFNFLDCPTCRMRIDHPFFESLVSPLMGMYEAIKSKALARLKMDGMEADDKLVDPSSDYFGKPELYALHSFAFYSCFKCKKPFFGGKRNCEDARSADNTPPEELVCFDCSDLKAGDCTNDGHKEFWLWKCRFCCNPAVWFCWGNTHFCEQCHQKAAKLERLRRDGKHSKFNTINKQPRCDGKRASACNLGVEHPPTGDEFCLGCGACQQEVDRKIADSRVDMSGGAGDAEGAPPPRRRRRLASSRRK